MTKIALCVELYPAQQERLRRGIGAYELVIRTGNSHQADCLQDCEIAFGNPPADRLELAEKLRWVQLESVGFGEYTQLDWARLSQSLTLTNLAGFFAKPVAETALAGLLAMTRGIGRLVRLQGSATWEGDPIRTQLRLLQGAKVVMVGFGAINQRLGELLVPFGCHITPIRRNSPVAELDAALIDADILVCTAPDTPETRGLFSAARLALLPARAIFANFGRGSIVDEMALATALQTGRLAGAVLDVTRDEPLPADHSFWTCPNILLTQHSGGGSADELDRKIDHFLDNLSRYRRGEALSGAVDFERGY
jgi:glyoxylate/hydroxypyruvate reductase A